MSKYFHCVKFAEYITRKVWIIGTFVDYRHVRGLSSRSWIIVTFVDYRHVCNLSPTSNISAVIFTFDVDTSVHHHTVQVN
jgi:hypothetical protein